MVEDSDPGSFAELVGNMENTDPRLRLLAEFMKRQKDTEMTDNRKKEARRKRVKNMILELKRENEMLIEMNDLLASALGACPYCWGEDVTCECRGQGWPGSQPPDEDAFNDFVMPVIKRFGKNLLQTQSTRRKEVVNHVE